MSGSAHPGPAYSAHARNRAVSSRMKTRQMKWSNILRGSPGVSRRQSHGTPCSTRGPDTLSGVFFSHARAKQGMLAFVCECAVPDVGVLASEFHNVQLISGQHPAAALFMPRLSQERLLACSAGLHFSCAQGMITVSAVQQPGLGQPGPVRGTRHNCCGVGTRRRWGGCGRRRGRCAC